MSNKPEITRLDELKSFPLYACSKEIIRRYKPYLDPLDLTYTQYIALMVLWEKKNISVKALGECLYLDSGTMTPVLKKLESKGYITRTRSVKDERSVEIELTERGAALEAETAHFPKEVRSRIALTDEEDRQLGVLLRKLLKGFEEE